jgi:hypothetical protein
MDTWLKPFANSALEAANAGGTTLQFATSAFSLNLPSLPYVLHHSCITAKLNNYTVDTESPTTVIFAVPVSLHVGFFIRVPMLLNTGTNKFISYKNNQTGIFSVTLTSEVTIYDYEYAVVS